MVHITVNPTDVFDKPALQQALGLKHYTLAREVREKRLKVYKRAGKYWFLGVDVLDWIRAGEKEMKKAD